MTGSVRLIVQTKALDDDQRTLEGWATRPEEDRVGDTVLPRGATYKLPLPFLLDHDHSKAVGHVDRVEVTDKGIQFWAHIKKIAEPGEVQQMCDTAWQLVKNGLRQHVSIGFRILDAEPAQNSRGLKIKKWEWLELSAVSVPALASATITGVKGIGSVCVSVSPQSNQSTRTFPKGAVVNIDAEEFGKAVGAAVRKVADRLEKRIAELESKLDALADSSLKYAGEFQEALDYKRGAVVKSGGDLYTAVRDVQAGKSIPGRHGAGWTKMS